MFTARSRATYLAMTEDGNRPGRHRGHVCGPDAPAGRRLRTLAWAFHIAVDRAPGYGAQFALVSRIEYSRSSDVMPDGTPPK